jgi:prolyl-tRNA editing enzyme YbaK/EbsC (Cys-tRNA(Pro) deacylase)
VWPDSVERIAGFLRASGTEGRLEQVLAGTGPPPGLELRAHAFECEARTVVGLIPSARGLDRQKLAAAAECTSLRRAGSSTGFPFQGAAVFLERAALGAQTVWLELDVPRHFLGLAPSQLLRLTRAKTADLLSENRTGEVDDRAQG